MSASADRLSHGSIGTGTQDSSDETSLLDRTVKQAFQSTQEEVSQPDHVSKSSDTRTSLLIIGAYLTALSFAAIHYVFFRLIDGREVSNIFSLRQSQVSTVSLLLVTGFRAAVVAVIGACFTQYLWHLLRINCFRVGLIEDLFQLRSSPLVLTNPSIFRRAPILCLAAALSWLVPFATVYPPGALTIQSELQTSFRDVNASIFNPKPSQIADEYNTPSLATIRSGVNYHWFGVDGEAGFDYATYSGPNGALRSMTKFVMFTGQIVPMASLTGENSSYTLTFEGPRVQCRNLTTVRTLSPLEEGKSSLVVFNATWPTWDAYGNQSALAVTYTNALGFYPAPSKINNTCNGQGSCSWFTDPPFNATVTMLLERRVFLCDPYITTYRVDVTYVRGIQHITYSTSADQALRFPQLHDFRWNATENMQVPNDTLTYKEWKASLPMWYYQANIRAILDSVGENFEYQWSRSTERDDSNYTWDVSELPNGTRIELGKLTSGPGLLKSDTLDYTMLEDSIVNVRRFGQNDTYVFDPRTSLDISEASINALLANATISTLSLNTWLGNITVKDTHYRNVYRFSHRINLLLPYGLCLGFTSILIVIGLHALQGNGISATDGGFLQIMMTTTGDTTMNREVEEASLKGGRNAPQTLLDLKVRFGELVGAEDKTASRRYGFGTKEETIPLRGRS